MKLLKLCRNQWDRTAGVALVFGGFVALLAGWLSIRDMIFTFDQMPYVISGGFLGLGLIGMGCAAWVSADLRDEWRKLDSLQASVDALIAAPESAVVLPEGPTGDPAAEGTHRASARVSGGL